MCGIVGMAGNGVITGDHTIFQQLMQVSTLRGQDGTGIIQAEFKENKKPTWLIEKQPYEVNHFFDWCYGKDGNQLVLKSLFDNVYIGHVRDATKGGYTKENCHPFQSKSIIGVHNGTLDDTQYQDTDKSDSLLLYQDIAKRGAKEVLESLWPTSAFVLNWIDTATKKVYFARNLKRPLHVTRHKFRDVVYWASEAGMLEWMLDRHSVPFTEIKYFAPDQIYSLDPDKIMKDTAEIPFEVEKIKPADWEDLPNSKHRKKREQQYYELWGGAGYYSGSLYDDEWDDAVDVSGTNTPVTPKPGNNNIIPLAEIKKKEGKIPRVICAGCHKELNLAERYLADKVPTDGQVLYECQPCQNLASTLRKCN